jgi:NADPH:quinone reductase-like Zn-dependent oxidoreductase
VRRPAADGTGPAEGSRVVGLSSPPAGWAELVAIDTELLAELPDEVTFEQASTLPVAGLTALRAFEVGGYVVGKRVLVTGASGGVGRFAIQLGALAGAHVTALARRTEGLEQLGADEVITELEPEGSRFDVVIEGVGGPTLGNAIQRLVARGTIVSFAATTTEPVSYPPRALFGGAPGAQVYGLYLFGELRHTRSGSTDLRRLADLIAAGKLDPQIDFTVSWRDAGTAIDALLARRVNGKAVLTVD